MWELDLGGNLHEQGEARFKVWAPFQELLHLKLYGDRYPEPLPMEKDHKGYFSHTLKNVKEGTLYAYIGKNGKERADPVSRFMPEGVFGPSQLLSSSFAWTDGAWKGIPQEKLIFYECHVGAFTPEGTYRGVREKIGYLKHLGITCLELMPINQFSGRWNWGYDGVNLYAPQNTYGSPQELKELIDHCHKEGIAVCLDVVYNHFGPEGNFLHEWGPYHTKKYKTPWGDAINYDGPYSDEVRHFVLQNVLYWIHEFHIDGLRFDALHALFDFSASPFLKEISEAVEQSGKKAFLIAESDLNDSRYIRREGSGFQGLWNEDFHHAIHVALTGEQEGYYQDYQGIGSFKKALLSGVIYQGEYSKFRKRRQGNSFRGVAREKLVNFIQNHDQIGNSPFNDRLALSLSFPSQKLAALCLLLSPSLPLLFMGQEYGEETPFPFFVDYRDPKLIEKVYEGRKKEFGHAAHPTEHAFSLSKLSWKRKEEILKLYQTLIDLRKKAPLKGKLRVFSKGKWIAWEYKLDAEWLGVFCNFNTTEEELELPFQGKIIFHTDQKEFGGGEVLSHDPDKNSLRVPGVCGLLLSNSS